MHAQEPVTEFMWAGDRPTPYPSNRDCGLLRVGYSVADAYQLDPPLDWGNNEDLDLCTVCPGSSDPPDKIFNIFASENEVYTIY